MNEKLEAICLRILDLGEELKGLPEPDRGVVFGKMKAILEMVEALKE